jgi:ATP-dependent exoDNAse (exonuclease V) alpha subunit
MMMTASSYVYSHRQDFPWLDADGRIQTDACLFSKPTFVPDESWLRVRELNTALQGALKPPRPGELAAARFSWRFRVRDKVIQTENDYKKEVFNGDIGTIEKIDSVEQELSIRFEDRLVKYDYSEVDEVSLAYVVTIHKSQG